jgi:hypothetical protein
MIKQHAGSLLKIKFLASEKPVGFWAFQITLRVFHVPEEPVGVAYLCPMKTPTGFSEPKYTFIFNSVDLNINQFPRPVN